MAVCGRCLICGHKFSCDGEDEAIRWRCKSCNDKEHAICTTCHNGLVDGSLERDVGLLVSLVASRSASQQRE